MDQEDIMFFKNQDESYTMIDLYLYEDFLGTKILTIIMILMLIKYDYLKKVMVNILLDKVMYIIQKLYHYN